MSTQQRSMRTSLGKVRGHGAGHGGTGHFIGQRVSAVALLLLAPWFVISFALAMRQPQYVGNPDNVQFAGAIDYLSQPLNAVGVVLLVIAALYHMQIGMQEIVVDYIERPLTKALLLVLNTLFCVALAAGAIYAVLNISFGKG